jgi:enoyl-[acyl-carrier protein] reductase II
VIASGSMPPGLLDAEIAATAALTDKPFGVNLITMHPQLTELIDVCLARHVGHVVLAGGIPGAAAIQRLRDGGARVVCFAPILDAKLVHGSAGDRHRGQRGGRSYRAGIDRGPAQEGCRTSSRCRPSPADRAGEHAVYLEMGASGVQLGTRFVCPRIARPSRASSAFIRAAARDAVISPQLDAVSGHPGALANPATERFRAVSAKLSTASTAVSWRRRRQARNRAFRGGVAGR